MATPNLRGAVSIGCSGFHYDHWKQTFYPKDVPASKALEYYSTIFDTVEINSTYYRWPTEKLLKGWAGKVPDEFSFILKLNRHVTHYKKMKNTAQEVKDFYKIAKSLGVKLGGFLFQFPPSVKYDERILKDLVQQTDQKFLNIVEFRHKSWWREEVFAAFKKHKLVFCTVDSPDLPRKIVQTADTVYIRVHGRKEWYGHEYSDKELKILAQKIKKLRAKKVLVYFNNDAKGFAPKNAQTLMDLLQISPAVGTGQNRLDAFLQADREHGHSL